MLALIEQAQLLPPEKLAGLKQETDELIAIITTIIVKKKQNRKDEV